MLAHTFEELEGSVLVDEDGGEETLQLLPPASPQEIVELEARLPAPLPSEIRDALAVTKGIASGPLETLSLLDLPEFGMEDLFPCAHPIGHDGFGNYWVVDLVPGSKAWGPVLFACHDPPVIAFQAETVADFVRHAVAMWQPGARSPVDVVHEEVTMEIWRSRKPMDREWALASEDAQLRTFATGHEPGAVFADLRTAEVGDGFVWACFGPQTEWMRHGSERLWSATAPPERPSLLRRLFGGGTMGDVT